MYSGHQYILLIISALAAATPITVVTAPYRHAATTLMTLQETHDIPPVQTSTLIIKTRIPAKDIESIGFELSHLALKFSGDQRIKFSTPEPLLNSTTGHRQRKNVHPSFNARGATTERLRILCDALQTGRSHNPHSDTAYYSICDSMEPLRNTHKRRYRRGEFCLTIVFWTSCHGGGDTKTIKTALDSLDKEVGSLHTLVRLSKRKIVELATVEKQDFHWTVTQLATLGTKFSQLASLVAEQSQETYRSKLIDIASNLARGTFPIAIFASAAHHQKFFNMVYKNKNNSRGLNQAFNMKTLAYGNVGGYLWIVAHYPYLGDTQTAFKITPLPQQLSNMCVRPALQATKMILDLKTADTQLWDDDGPILHFGKNSTSETTCEALAYLQAASAITEVGNIINSTVRDFTTICDGIDMIHISRQCVKIFSPMPGFEWDAHTRTLYFSNIKIFEMKRPMYVEPIIPKAYHPQIPNGRFDFSSYKREWKRKERQFVSDHKKAKEAIDKVKIHKYAVTTIVSSVCGVIFLIILIYVCCRCCNSPYSGLLPLARPALFWPGDTCICKNAAQTFSSVVYRVAGDKNSFYMYEALPPQGDLEALGVAIMALLSAVLMIVSVLIGYKLYTNLRKAWYLVTVEAAGKIETFVCYKEGRPVSPAFYPTIRIASSPTGDCYLLVSTHSLHTKQDLTRYREVDFKREDAKISISPKTEQSKYSTSVQTMGAPYAPVATSHPYNPGYVGGV